MKIVLAILVLTLSGCSTYQTHLRTGCIWSCDDWKDYTPNPYAGTSANTQYMSATQYNLPSGGYMAIRSGSTVSVIQTSRSK